MSTDLQNYSASDRLLDEAVDQAVREEYPSGQQWRTEEPVSKPKAPPVVHVLDLDGTSIKVEARGDGRWWVTLIHGATVRCASESEAKTEAIAVARKWLTAALAKLPADCQQQPSVTAATSAALVQDYAGKALDDESSTR
jgi:hypothetical protein